NPAVGQEPLVVSFTASASGGTPPYSYSWDFDDGTASIQQNPAHTYPAGNYTAVLVITDGDGETITKTASIAVSSGIPPSGTLLRVSVSPTTARVGDTITASVEVQNIADLYSYEATLNFNDAILDFSSISGGTFLGGMFIQGIPDDGKIRQVAELLLPPADGKSGTGILFTARFVARAQGASQFTLSSVRLVGSSLNDITGFSNVVGTVTIT
ncbi:MAG: PKD domain-containing protein, partial [Candidatus Altiarchaeota archaeon]|nr:PKD domain-containing protein [Candidatus Altiarchaeota archaeon]